LFGRQQLYNSITSIIFFFLIEKAADNFLSNWEIEFLENLRVFSPSHKEHRVTRSAAFSIGAFAETEKSERGAHRGDKM